MSSQARHRVDHRRAIHIAPPQLGEKTLRIQPQPRGISRSLPGPSAGKLCRHRRVPKIIAKEIGDRELDSVLHLALPQRMQVGRPLPVFGEILRHPLGKEDVARIATVHHPLRQIDPRPRDVGPLVQIGHFAYRAAVNPHSHPNLGALLESARHFQGALRRFFRIIAKDQRHPVAGRQPDELLVGRFKHLRCGQHNIGELAHLLFLLVDQELGVTHYIEEEHMPDLQPKIVP